MLIEFRPHPAQARHPITNAPLFYDDGKTPVPLIKDQESVYLDGFHVGYTKNDGSWLSTVHFLQPAILTEVQKAVTARYNKEPVVHQPPEPTPEPTEVN